MQEEILKAGIPTVRLDNTKGKEQRMEEIMLHQQYYIELEKYNKLIERKNVKADNYNGIYDR